MTCEHCKRKLKKGPADWTRADFEHALTEHERWCPYRLEMQEMYADIYGEGRQTDENRTDHE